MKTPIHGSILSILTDRKIKENLGTKGKNGLR